MDSQEEYTFITVKHVCYQFEAVWCTVNAHNLVCHATFHYAEWKQSHKELILFNKPFFFFFLPSWYRIKICSVCEINMWSSVNYFMGKTVKSSETRVKGLSPDGAWKTSKWHHNNLVTGQQTKLMLVLSILKHALCIWMHFVMPKNGPETQIVWSFSIEFSFNKTRSNVLFFLSWTILISKHISISDGLYFMTIWQDVLQTLVNKRQ